MKAASTGLSADDSTSMRNYSNALYLKNADSTTIKNGIAATYMTLVQRGTDTTRAIVREGAYVAKTDSATYFMPRAQITTALNLKLNITDTSSFSNQLSLKAALTAVLKNADSTTIKNGIAATYTTLAQRGTDTSRAIVREKAIAYVDYSIVLDSTYFTTYGTRAGGIVPWFRAGKDSVKVDSIHVTMPYRAVGDTVSLTIVWGPSSETGTDSLAATIKCYHGIAGLSTGSTKVIPPNNWVSIKVTEADGATKKLNVTLEGYKKWY
jgi:hypothetical protein